MTNDEYGSLSPIIQINLMFMKNNLFRLDQYQSWNRSDFFGPDRIGRSGFFDRTGPDRPVQIHHLTAKYR